MDADGTTERINDQMDDIDVEEELTFWKRTKMIAYRYNNINDAVSGAVWARDEAHAVKIANEFRAAGIIAGEIKVKD